MDALTDLMAGFIGQLCLVQLFAMLTLMLGAIALRLMGIGKAHD